MDMVMDGVTATGEHILDMDGLFTTITETKIAMFIMVHVPVESAVITA
jgi:hypothetical protein